ncbi:MAG: Lipoate-protein ligase A, partial [uncultured Thermomicrobiales bacterium]
DVPRRVQGSRWQTGQGRLHRRRRDPAGRRRQRRLLPLPRGDPGGHPRVAGRAPGRDRRGGDRRPDPPADRPRRRTPRDIPGGHRDRGPSRPRGAGLVPGL